jgi:MFS family permease
MDEIPRTRPPRDPEAALWKNLPRNVTGMLLFEFIWGFGLPFGLYVSMVPAYLTDLGATKSLMGFVMTFWTILIPLQILAGHFFRERRRVQSVISLYVIATSIRLLYDLFAVFVPGAWTPQARIGFFVLANIVYVGLLIMGQSIYMGVLTDNIPRRRRGWVFGLRTLFMGLGGLLTAAGAAWVLHHWSSPLNFRVAFLICDALWTASSVSLFLLRDRPARNAFRRQAKFVAALKGKIGTLIADPSYRIFLFFHMLNSVALIIASFIVPFAKERLGIPDSQMTWLSIIYLAANAGLGFLLGKLADKAGYRSVGATMSFMLLVVFLIAVSARSFAAVCVAYGLYSVANISSAFILVNMSVELCPSIGVTDLTAIGGTLLLPFVAVASPLAGLIIDLTGSYPAVFLIGATVAAIALFGFAFLVREPRTGRLWVLKQVAMR